MVEKLSKVILLQIFGLLSESIKLIDQQKCAVILKLFEEAWLMIKRDVSAYEAQLLLMIERCSEIVNFNAEATRMPVMTQSSWYLVNRLQGLR